MKYENLKMLLEDLMNGKTLYSKDQKGKILYFNNSLIVKYDDNTEVPLLINHGLLKTEWIVEDYAKNI